MFHNILKPNDDASKFIPTREFQRILKTIELMKMFEERYLSTPTRKLSLIKYQITKELILQSHALLCKNPIEGYMKATGLPQEIIESILINYVGLIYINKNQSNSTNPSNGMTNFKYREMNMNTMRKLIEKHKNSKNWFNHIHLLFERIFKTLYWNENIKNMTIILIIGIIISSFTLIIINYRKEN